MRIANASIDFDTPERVCILNVTRECREALQRSGIRGGLAILSVPHTTCGLCVNEDEPGLRCDLQWLASRLVELVRPPGGFQHDRIDNNAHAHLTSTLLGPSVSLPIAAGNLSLGSWQSLLLVESDGPRKRRLDLVFLGD